MREGERVRKKDRQSERGRQTERKIERVGGMMYDIFFVENLRSEIKTAKLTFSISFLFH